MGDDLRWMMDTDVWQNTVPQNMDQPPAQQGVDLCLWALLGADGMSCSAPPMFWPPLEYRDTCAFCRCITGSHLSCDQRVVPS